ncbi:photosystem II protein Psb27 [Gloeomargarita lithophora Alchichica-D10]|uniref:Photosystem II lipoprotein Psb27 n=1 Tax=Gloeomargarita lithophora Alchichica-D10 TaxID=1188229 RepID=A0A1J0AEB8_9CYAN|nr:photosystem II protein Psb27 [Gloeomargarita lithophora]APB34294.1 photosystem II protein Psb27 [Gloeomargarita lithophora Alchichica-D10]
MKQLRAVLVGLMLVLVVMLAGCGGAMGSLSGNYTQDTLTLVQTLRQAVALPEDDPSKSEFQTTARQQINDFAARYRRDGGISGLLSFTTMRTALNALAGHYSSYPGRPLPEKLKNRLTEQLDQVELALKRGN